MQDQGLPVGYGGAARVGEAMVAWVGPMAFAEFVGWIIMAADDLEGCCGGGFGLWGC